MVLEVLPDARQMLHNRNSESLQLILIYYTGLHQYLWGVNCTQGQDDFGHSSDAAHLPFIKDYNTCDPLSFKGQPRNQSLSQYSKIRPAHIREDVATEDRLTISIAHPNVSDGRTTFTLHHSAILIFINRNSNRPASFKHSWAIG
jgi:hypothetical protein